jgi:hypothetical protein
MQSYFGQIAGDDFRQATNEPIFINGDKGPAVAPERDYPDLPEDTSNT